MSKILAFGASNSKNSINKQFAKYVAQKIYNNVEVLDLNDYEVPIYSIDKEKEFGIPPLIIDFYNKIQSADLIVISFAEYNGSYTSAFKNIFDWASRQNVNMFEKKQLIVLSTSPGARGGASILETVVTRMPRHGAEIVFSYSLPNFNDNFQNGELVNETIKSELDSLIQSSIS